MCNCTGSQSGAGVTLGAYLAEKRCVECVCVQQRAHVLSAPPVQYSGRNYTPTYHVGRDIRSPVQGLSAPPRRQSVPGEVVTQHQVLLSRQNSLQHQNYMAVRAPRPNERFNGAACYVEQTRGF